LVFSGSAVSTTTDEGEGAGEVVEESKVRVLNSLGGGGGESDEVARYRLAFEPEEYQSYRENLQFTLISPLMHLSACPKP
jgi:hypothetical protein